MRGLLVAVTIGVLGLVFLVATRPEWEGASYLLALLLLVPTVMAVLFLAAKRSRYGANLKQVGDVLELQHR